MSGLSTQPGGIEDDGSFEAALRRTQFAAFDAVSSSMRADIEGGPSLDALGIPSPAVDYPERKVLGRQFRSRALNASTVDNGPDALAA